MSGITPVSRAYMQGLKGKKDKEDRLIRIQQIVQQIYTKVLNTAGQTSKTSFEYSIPSVLSNEVYVICPFQKANIEEIIGELKTIFPDSSIKHIQKVVPRHVEYIMIDWS